MMGPSFNSKCRGYYHSHNIRGINIISPCYCPRHCFADPTVTVIMMEIPDSANNLMWCWSRCNCFDHCGSCFHFTLILTLLSSCELLTVVHTFTRTIAVCAILFFCASFVCLCKFCLFVQILSVCSNHVCLGKLCMIGQILYVLGTSREQQLNPCQQYHRCLSQHKSPKDSSLKKFN